MKTSLRNSDKTGTSLDRILYLSDQNEYRHYCRMEKDSHRQKRNILIITRPLLQKEFITEKCEGMFDHIFSWRDLVPPSFNPFTKDYLTEPELINIIEAAKWPQSLSEILESDQHAHTSVSGRFYQGNYRQTSYLSNCFAITYSLTKHAIGCAKPCVAYTSEIRDVNKIGALCALLIAGIPIVVPESVNIRDLVLLKVIRRKDNHISNVFYGQDEAMPFELFRNSESKVGNKIYINWDLYGCMKDTGLSETSSQDINRVMRATQYEKRGTTERINAPYEMRRFASNFKTLLRSAVATPKRLAKAHSNFMIPLHKKNSMHYLQSLFGKQVYSIVCRYRSIRDRLLLQCHAFLRAKHCSRRILCLHYFPESSTIGGVSWRNIKHELALLAIPEVQHYLHPGDVTVVEHPAYLMNGERPRSFWRRLTKLGYRYQVRRSLGDALSNIAAEQIITITGSIALEAALLGKESVIVKNSQLLIVQNINHISDVLDIRDFVVQCRKKLSANKYVHICQSYALSQDKIYPMQVLESAAHEE